MPGFFNSIASRLKATEQAELARKREVARVKALGPHRASNNIAAKARESVPAWRYECEKVLRGMSNSCKFIVNDVGDGYMRDDYSDPSEAPKKVPLDKMNRQQIYALMAYKTLQHYLQTCHESYPFVAHELITGRHLVFATTDPKYAKEHFHNAPTNRGAIIAAIMRYFTDLREADYLVSQNRRVPDGMIVELYNRMHARDIFALQAVTSVKPEDRDYREAEVAKHKQTFFTSNSGSRNFILHLGMRMDQLQRRAGPHATTH